MCAPVTQPPQAIHVVQQQESAVKVRVVVDRQIRLPPDPEPTTRQDSIALAAVVDEGAL